MESTIKLDNGKKIKLANNIKWLKIYKAQFLHDITPDIVPMLTAALTIGAGIEDGRVEETSLREALFDLANAELTTLMDITWAMAKCKDSNIPDPDTWLEELGVFPVDIIAPEVINMAAKGLVSSKNLKRLQTLREALEPWISNQFTSQDSQEGSPSETSNK